MKHPYIESGSWNVVCSMCGFQFKSSEVTKHWQGMYRCAVCWEPRHPQDFTRNITTERPPPWTQPPGESPISYTCTPNGTSAVPGFAIPGCLIPGYLHPFFDPEVEDAP